MEPTDWPRATAELPGCGGAFKASPEDFEVEELPAYAPSGAGEHLYLWIEKVDRDTPQVARSLARAVGLPEREVSYAGLKDRHAVTRQLFSLPARAAEGKLEAWSEPGVKVLWRKRHGNKLRSGHLRGNAFKIRIRGATEPGAARAVLARLAETGLPNYFGLQRFGRAGDNAAQGKALLLGERLPRRPDRFQRRLFLSAYQSLLFNRALAARLREGTLGRALAGDVLRKQDTGGQFVCAEPAADQARVERFEVSPAGPIFGPKMIRAAGEVDAAEQRLLADEGLTLAAFERGGGETEGTRRPYRLPFADAALTEEGSDLWLSFTLPAGSYATVVLDEVMKGPPAVLPGE